MGSAQSLHSLVKGTEEKLISANETGDFCAGLAHTIMFHEKNSRYTVLGSAPRYKRLLGLQRFATDTRNKYLEKLQSTLNEATITRVREVENVSKGISQAAREGNPPTEPPAEYERILIDGMNITVTAKGKYKPACLIDYLRLTIARPPEAAAEEAKLPATQRMPQNFKACAEWLMVCYLFSSPDPTSRPVQTPAPGHGRAAKNDKTTGPTQQPQQQQQGTASMTGHPSHLPPLGNPKAGNCRASSSPASTTKLVDRTKAAAAKGTPNRKVSGQTPTSAANPRGSGR